MKNIKLIDVTIQAMIATIYAVVTVVLAPISYGSLQFRVSEILIILALFNKKHIIGLTIGCFVANLFSPMLFLDLPFGTLATFLSVFYLNKFNKKPYLALILPSIFNGVIVGLMLNYAFKLPLIESMISVFIGEFVVTYVFGLPIYYRIKETNYKDFFELKFSKKKLSESVR